MSLAHSLNVREFTPGPEDPSEMFEEGYKIIRTRQWLFKSVVGVAGGLSGLMFLFLAIVFVWRRSLVNRVSLRLIALISLLDLIQCTLQTNNKERSMSGLRCLNFFIDFASFGSIYLAASIAFNLQMVFLRKSRSPLPRYIELLYFAVPLTVSFLQFVPQYIYSAIKGFGTSGEDIASRTPAYLWYTLMGTLFIPYVFVTYSVVTSTMVIYSLYTKQKAITRVLDSVSQESNSLLDSSSTVKDSSSASASRTSVSMSSKERQQLKLARNVYKVSIRIALYPIAPLFSVTIMSIYYIRQYFVTLTYKSDVHEYVWLTTMGYFMFPIFAFINFIIFLTDPAVVKVVAEVRRTIRIKTGRTDNFKGSSSDGLHSPDRVVGKKTSVTISESGVLSETMQVDSSSLLSTYDLEKANDHRFNSLFGTPAGLEESRPFASALDGLHDDAVMRRVRAPRDGESDYQELL
ncbi:hypothetical protein GGI20_005572 [Coemansia sp. BCRC 34301]|nr:hypothetical protein GGI20_005572 [Coemansia sp. BCRC 34301]